MNVPFPLAWYRAGIYWDVSMVREPGSLAAYLAEIGNFGTFLNRALHDDGSRSDSWGNGLYGS